MNLGTLYLIVTCILFISFVFYNRYKKLFTSRNMNSDKEETFAIILAAIILWPFVLLALIVFGVFYLIYKLIVPSK
jgi:Na+/proline symporter